MWSCQLPYSAGFKFNDSEPSAHLHVRWGESNSHGTLEQSYWLGAYLMLLDSASLSPPISSANFELETPDIRFGARFEALSLPVGLEAELVKDVTAL